MEKYTFYLCSISKYMLYVIFAVKSKNFAIFTAEISYENTVKNDVCKPCNLLDNKLYNSRIQGV